MQATLGTHKNKNTAINCERWRPVFTRPGFNCIKTHDFPRAKYQPSSFLNVCKRRVPLPKLLHLVQQRQQHKDPPPLTHSQRHASVEDRPQRPLTHSICAAPRPLTPRSDSAVAPAACDAQSPSVTLTFHRHKAGLPPRSFSCLVCFSKDDGCTNKLLLLSFFFFLSPARSLKDLTGGAPAS